jgi:hypothetical protein
MVASIFLMFAQVEGSISDLLTEGKYAELMVRRPRTGSDLVSYVWLMCVCTSSCSAEALRRVLCVACRVLRAVWCGVWCMCGVLCAALHVCVCVLCMADVCCAGLRYDVCRVACGHTQSRCHGHDRTMFWRHAVTVTMARCHGVTLLSWRHTTA